MNDALPFFVGGAILILVCVRLISARPRMPAAQAFAAHKLGHALIIDVREPSEWSAGVARPAHLLPLSDLRGPRKLWKPILEKNQGKQLLIYCHSGMRSASAAALLRREGWDAVNLGSFRGWFRAGLPVRRP